MDITAIFNVQESQLKNCKLCFKNIKKKLRNNKRESKFKINNDFQFRKFINA